MDIVWNILARVATAGLRLLNAGNCIIRRQSRPTAVSRILIVKLDAIGDFILATPFLRELKRSFPTASVTLVIAPAAAPLAQSCPYVDRVIIFNPSGSSSKQRQFLCVRACLLGLRLWPLRFDLAIIPRWDHDGYKGYHLLCSSGAKRIAAYARTLGSVKTGWLHRIETRHATILENGTSASEVLINLRLLEAIGGQIKSDHLELWLSTEDRRRAKSWIQEVCPPSAGPLVALGIGASIAAKCWAEQNFVELIKILTARFDARFVLVGGGPFDKRRAATIVQAANGLSVFNAVDQFSLRETAALLENCQLFIGNDSGPMHLAAAVNVPIVQIFGISEEDDEKYEFPAIRFGPWKVPARIVRPPRASAMTDRFMNEGNLYKMETITVKRVSEAVAELLEPSLKKITSEKRSAPLAER